MLDYPTLRGIAEGSISLAFRRWKRPTVRRGSSLRTSVGVLAVEAVDEVAADDVSEAEARRAGFDDRAALLASLRAGEDRTLYRVRLRFVGADPRTELAGDDDLTADELRRIRETLDGIDRRSRRGPWTRPLLMLLRDNPGVPARELAARSGRPTDRLKADVRTLKEYGLVRSLDTGYRLSPRGARVVERDGGGGEAVR